MEDFIVTLSIQASGLSEVLESFFATIRHHLRKNLGSDNVEEGAIIMDDLSIRVVNQLLAYNFQQWRIEDVSEQDEIPHTGDIDTTWSLQLATHIHTLVEPYLALQDEDLIFDIDEELKLFLEPSTGASHKCYPCYSVFQRDGFSECSACQGWLVVEVDPVLRDFTYPASSVVPWEYERLTLQGVSALDEFGQFADIEFADIAYDDDNKECPICKSKEAHVADGMKRTTCQHVLGRSCLEGWLESNDHCPVCRNKFLADARNPCTTLLRRSREIRRNNPN